MKAKLTLLETSPSSPQNPKTPQPNNKGLVAEIFDWDVEEVSDDEEVTQVNITIRKVNTLLSMDEDADWQNYLKYINIDLKDIPLSERLSESITQEDNIEETYLVTFNESIEAIRFTNTLVDEIRMDDSSIYPPDEFFHKDDPSRQYQVDYDISYYVISHG
nr:retrovirus-related Pol polyprotein from transposon TNT 1-94 [Tanacetum cinerariifolium]